MLSDNVRETLLEADSLLIMLENDLTSVKADETHIRAVHVIHRLIRSAADSMEAES